MSISLRGQRNRAGGTRTLVLPVISRMRLPLRHSPRRCLVMTLGLAPRTQDPRPWTIMSERPKRASHTLGVPGGTRTHNRRFRRPVPFRLDHGNSCAALVPLAGAGFAPTPARVLELLRIFSALARVNRHAEGAAALQRMLGVGFEPTL